MEHGANPNTTNDFGDCLFDHIISTDRVELFEIFYMQIINHDNKRDKNKRDAKALIHRCAGASGPDCLEYYLSKNKHHAKNLVL